MDPLTSYIIWIGIGLAAAWLALALDFWGRVIEQRFTRWLTKKFPFVF
jgi:hypothetical protein